MKKILLVIDMQNDFIDGPLGTPEARSIVNNVCRKIRETDLYTDIFVTMDTHADQYLESNEGKHLPVKHCIYGTDGWKLNSKIEKALKDAIYIYDQHPRYRIVTKKTFACEKLIDGILRASCHYNDIEITLVGVCTDICVISNALLLKAHFPEARIVVDASCCAGSTSEKHLMALSVMESCQIDIVGDV